MNRLLILLFFYIGTAFSQDSSSVFSVYFDSKAKPNTKEIVGIDAKYHEEYSLIGRNELDLRVASGDHLIVDETGVYLEKNRLLSISRTEIRENSAYHLNDGYLHGVLPNDSVLVALDGEHYYFLIPTKTYLYQVDNKIEHLYQGRTPNEFIIVTREKNGYNSLLMLSFTANQITLSAIDIEQKAFDFRTVTGKVLAEDEIPVYILSPTKPEWNEIINHFIVYDTYHLEEL